MITPLFKAVAAAIRDAHHDMNTYALLETTDKVLSLVEDFAPGKAEIEMAVYKTICRNSEQIRASVENGKKVDAIIHLRKLTGCGLKQAKDAVEATSVF